MPKILLFAIITVLSCLPASSQSDDGWFTGRLFLSHLSNGDGSALQVGYTHYYNIDNHFSVGTATGVIFDDGINIPLQTELRIRPFGKKPVAPVVMLSGGYVFGYQVATISPRIGIESGRLRRVRYAADAGMTILGDVCALTIGAGLLF